MYEADGMETDVSTYGMGGSLIDDREGDSMSVKGTIKSQKIQSRARTSFGKSTAPLRALELLLPLGPGFDCGFMIDELAPVSVRDLVDDDGSTGEAGKSLCGVPGRCNSLFIKSLILKN